MPEVPSGCRLRSRPPYLYPTQPGLCTEYSRFVKKGAWPAPGFRSSCSDVLTPSRSLATSFSSLVPQGVLIPCPVTLDSRQVSKIFYHLVGCSDLLQQGLSLNPEDRIPFSSLSFFRNSLSAPRYPSELPFHLCIYSIIKA